MFNALHVNDLTLYRSSLIDSFNHIGHAFSTRLGGVSPEPYNSLNLGLNVGDSDENVVRNRDLFLKSINAGQGQLACGVQVHGNRVQRVENPGLFDATDALITDKKNIVLAIKTADCVPVLLYNPVHHVLAAVHGGWRSVKQDIVPKTVNLMSSEYGAKPDDIYCAIGPSIRPCCYEVQRDMADQFPTDSINRKDDRLFLNLVEVIKSQLLVSGLLPGRIDDSEICTCCHYELFFSYRREGAQSGRMMMAAVLKY
ncbi:peptidoglycan editing factor PgeF [bacterium]|nr:peptidoglycan editing factor PgeF [bacterium]MBU1063739.1 peptidoglycan editing factor PgeF [bacterium]MBU1633006.1 peptidoglycan editing factor PgeF [bacterium]MBU1873045.1 peptidoglycan editing factor PgeF [bacterium]